MDHLLKCHYLKTRNTSASDAKVHTPRSPRVVDDLLGDPTIGLHHDPVDALRGRHGVSLLVHPLDLLERPALGLDPAREM